MKWLFPLCLLPLSAAAAEAPPYELGLGPSLSYSTSQRYQFSPGVFFKVPVSEHFQLKIGDENLISEGGKHRFVAGVAYNFGEEPASSFFAGAGGGWQRQGVRKDGLAKNYWFGFVEAGKRFTLVRSWGLSYAPQVQFSWGPESKPELKIMPANLSFFF